jgi:hypothetical protein
MPWLTDPLGQEYMAWSLPVDAGWGVHSNLLNYGIVCLSCLLLVLAGIYADWRASMIRSSYTWRSACLAGVLCFVPLVLLLWQYIFADLPAMSTLAQHETQLLLIQNQYGYTSPDQFIRMLPFTVSASTLADRLSLLVNVLGPGAFLPCIAGIIALVYARIVGGSSWLLQYPQTGREKAYFFPLFKGKYTASNSTISSKNVLGSILRLVRAKWTVAVVGSVLLLVFLGRAPAAVVCEYAAQQSLTVGDYASTLRWLDRALWLNPDLEQVPDFHIERGNAWYYLFHDNGSDDSRAYIASVYREQGNFLGAYDELLQVWHSHNEQVSPWVRDEMSITLERLSEHALRNSFLSPVVRYNPSALPWLRLLGQVDPSNVYSQYVSGRIYYVQNSYDACMEYMQQVLTIGAAAPIRSSAYTYIGLSLEGQGKSSEARQFLFLAVRLDPYYHNDTAREELSGLH